MNIPTLIKAETNHDILVNVCGGLLFLGFSGYTFYLAATGEND